MRHISRKIIAMSMGIMMAGSAVCHISVQTSIVAEAHSGRTDASGGHRDNKNKSGLGSYHYHCGGHPAHLHTGGVCPYAAASSGSTQSTTSAPASEADTELTKQVQQALNDKGYDCGTPDGITGTNQIPGRQQPDCRRNHRRRSKNRPGNLTPSHC